jgi:hypothetical protein
VLCGIRESAFKPVSGVLTYVLTFFLRISSANCLHWCLAGHAQVEVTVERDPQRLLRPTEGWKERQKDCGPSGSGPVLHIQHRYRLITARSVWFAWFFRMLGKFGNS